MAILARLLILESLCEKVIHFTYLGRLIVGAQRRARTQGGRLPSENLTKAPPAFFEGNPIVDLRTPRFGDFGSIAARSQTQAARLPSERPSPRPRCPFLDGSSLLILEGRTFADFGSVVDFRKPCWKSYTLSRFGPPDSAGLMGAALRAARCRPKRPRRLAAHRPSGLSARAWVSISNC